MTPVDKYKKLADLLYSKTLNRNIEWRFDENFGIYSVISNRVVCLSQGRNAFGEPLEIVMIRSEEWEVIDQFDDEMLSGLRPASLPQFESYFSLMEAIREMAHRQSTGADDAVDDIIRTLEDDI